MKRIFSFLFFSFFSIAVLYGQTGLFYYLPENQPLDPAIPTPSSVIGFEVGEWQIRHDQQVLYLYELAKASKRVKVERYGKTYENRPLLNVIITSEENMDRLDEIRQQHLRLSDPSSSKDLDITSMPLIVRLGYTVHGNESSGANAAVLVAYYLAAARGNDMDSLLSKTVILIDPCLNPDGYQRFASWVNENRSKNLNPDPNNREANEPWPGGRTNHYWFDLNRDWLPAQHPESQGRLKLYHQWMPDIQTDHHEMGRNATFFFQPGIPSRNHPLVPEKGYELTEKIAAYHAKALDKYQRLYYTKESFDDFYFGKGSSYPDINGGVGILFEQASPRGMIRDTENGVISFPMAIKNQFIVSLSTLKAGYELRKELLEYQRTFYRTAIDDAKSRAFKAFIFGSNEDPYRSAKLAEMLLRHGIILYRPLADITSNGKIFKHGGSYIVPVIQPQYRLVSAIFERRTSFKDSLFYDISAWTMDLAFGLQIEKLNSKNVDKDLVGEMIEQVDFPEGKVDWKSKYAYAIDWRSYKAPALVNQLLKRNIRLKVATQPFKDHTSHTFGRGTIILPLGIQEKSRDEIYDLLEKYAEKYGVSVYALESGVADDGSWLGSNTFKTLRKPSVLLLTGNGVSSYEAGEVWHLLDQRMDIHVTMAETNRLSHIKLDPYTVLVMPGGWYSELGAPDVEKIRHWVKNGGTLIAWKSALKWLAKNKLANLEFVPAPPPDSTGTVPYANMAGVKGAQRIGGAIFNTTVDLTHPLLFGYNSEHIPVFRNSTLFLKMTNPYGHPIRYTDKPLMSGYISKENETLLKNTPAVHISSFGSGKIIAFTDDHNFRAYWFGTNRLTLNAIFFGHLIRTK